MELRALGFTLASGFWVLGFRGINSGLAGSLFQALCIVCSRLFESCAGAGCPWLTSPFPHSATLVARSKDLG